MCLLCICLLAMHTLIWSLFLFLLMSGVDCGFCLWLFLDFSVYLFGATHLAEFRLSNGQLICYGEADLQ